MQGVVTPNMVAVMSFLSWWAAAGARRVTRPRMAAAAWSRIWRLMRLMPQMSTTEFSMKMSLSPTNPRVLPLARVLTMTLGTPKGRARMAAVPMLVPPPPPSEATAASLPSA